MVAVFGTFFAEKLLGGMLGEVSGYLPFGLLNALLDGESTQAVPAGLVLAAITAALGALAAVLLRRRDLNYVSQGHMARANGYQEGVGGVPHERPVGCEARGSG